MIQDIIPRLENEYYNTKAKEQDFIFCFDNNKLIVKMSDNGITLPSKRDMPDVNLVYLFKIGEKEYFLSDILIKLEPTNGMKYEDVRKLREYASMEICFAASTAFHLYQWYRDNKYCGRCGNRLAHSSKERMLFCSCGNMVFPKIAPAVIVGVTDNSRILLTKYNGRGYNRYALIAGFTEIGETAEETVKREVMEEVGLKVKNIRYYKSQPWGTDSNLLLGYFAELDGSDKVKLDTEELSVAEWHDRDTLEVKDDGISLTRNMMSAFKKQRF